MPKASLKFADPTKPIDALTLAKDLTEALNGEQQLWLIDWLQQHNWEMNKDSMNINELEKLRYLLLSSVQPRLVEPMIEVLVVLHQYS